MDSYRLERLKRKSAEYTIAEGKGRFVRRHLAFILIAFVAFFVLATWMYGPSRKEVIASAVMLPIVALGGYLEATWRWSDLIRSRTSDR